VGLPFRQRSRGLFSFQGSEKTENSIDFRNPLASLKTSMQRPENAAKSVIFAFVARISLR
jgi:hypothetical protein